MSKSGDAMIEAMNKEKVIINATSTEAAPAIASTADAAATSAAAGPAQGESDEARL